MGRPFSALVVSLGLLVSLAPGQTPLAPTAGLVLLRNGSLIEGAVTRAGDVVVVTQGNDVELRLPARDVEAVCASLDEAYEFKLRHASGSGIELHLSLAEWCLRHGLTGRSSEQLERASAIDASHPQLKSLQDRLLLSQQAPPPAAAPPASPAGSASLEALDKAMQALPKASVEKFSGSIQPILLNRCGANQCHGPNARSAFRLLRPPSGQLATRRFTQRNLYAALSMLDRANPDASPLITKPQTRHGGSPTAIFDKHTQQQLAELIAWARLTVGASERPAAAPAPATIRPAQHTLSQPAASDAPAPAEVQAATGAGSVVTMRPLPEPPEAAGGSYAPRDPYDPELFNRRYHRP
jgi:hypothetical protein